MVNPKDLAEMTVNCIEHIYNNKEGFYATNPGKSFRYAMVELVAAAIRDTQRDCYDNFTLVKDN